jgi:hypothetical protein
MCERGGELNRKFHGRNSRYVTDRNISWKFLRGIGGEVKTATDGQGNDSYALGALHSARGHRRLGAEAARVSDRNTLSLFERPSRLIVLPGPFLVR